MDGMGYQEVPLVPDDPDDWETGADADSTREEAATADAGSADPTRRVWSTAELSEEVEALSSAYHPTIVHHSHDTFRASHNLSQSPWNR